MKWINYINKLNNSAVPFCGLRSNRLLNKVRDFNNLIRYFSSRLSTFSPVMDLKGNPCSEEFIEWFCGLTDGEGCFYISKIGRNFAFNFTIGLHLDDLNMLLYVQKTLALGRVEIKNNVANFIVNKKSEISQIIDIFNNRHLNTIKLLNFMDFKKALDIYNHPDKSEGKTREILSIRENMNTKRTDFKMPSWYKACISSNWLLGFVEGEGSFLVRKTDYMLIFCITQSSKDYALITAIKDFIYGLPQIDTSLVRKDSIRFEEQTFKEGISIVRLVITQQDLIKNVLIPFFDNLTWISKKEMDYCDWKTVLNLKDKGFHYTEDGKKVLNLILNQMNNNRLSTSLGTTVNREELDDEINRLLSGPSNIEIKQGRKYIIN